MVPAAFGAGGGLTLLLLIHRQHLTQWVGYCAKEKIKECVETLL